MTSYFTPALCAAALLAATSAQALTTASESATPGGDYSDTLGTGPNITVPVALPDGDVRLLGDLRLNCVAGDCSDTSGLRDPSDSFFLTVGADQEIQDLTVSISSGLDISGTLFDVIVNGPGTAISTSYLGTTTDAAVSTGTVFGPGTYNFFIGAASSSIDILGLVDWELNSVVVNTATAPVPLPASAPVLLAGLGALLALRRKKS